MTKSEVLGRLFFKKVSYLKTDFKDKTKVIGLAIQVESSVQRGLIYIDVINSAVSQKTMDNLNSNSETYNAEISIENPVIQLKSNGKYSIVCSALNFIK